MSMSEAKEVEAMTSESANENYFGVCPYCGKSDGYLNVGKGHWFYYETHRVKWFVGSNLFDSWKHETEEEQRGLYEKHGLGEFAELGLNEVTPPEMVDA